MTASVLSRDAVHSRFGMFTEDLDPDAGFLCEEQVGYFDPTGALTDLKAACERMGVQIQQSAAVPRIALNSDGTKATGVIVCPAKAPMSKAALATTEMSWLSGRPSSSSHSASSSSSAASSPPAAQTKDAAVEISAGAVVNVAGPWGMALNTASGIDFPWRIVPTRVQVAYKKCDELTPERLASIPCTADEHNGTYFRPQLGSRQLLMGTILPEEESEEVDPDSFPTYVDAERETRYVSGVLARMPFLQPRGAITGFSALYSVNMDDGHPVVGAHPSIGGLFHAHGFTGHGFKISPVVGSMLSRAILGSASASTAHGVDTSVDPAFFAIDRLPHRISHVSVLA